jgi:O-antigen ligase
MIAVVIGALAIAAYYADSVAGILGKDADMSGRTRVWQYAVAMIVEHPWLGYGYSTFWEGFNSPGGVFWSLTGLGVPHSHNGYLELALDAGGIGVVLFMSALALVIFKLSWLIRHGNDPLIEWAVAFMGLFMVSNLSETRLWVVNQPFTVLFVYIVVYVNHSVWQTLRASQRRRLSSSRISLGIHPIGSSKVAGFNTR